jgi:hypothetical protein
MHTRFWSETVRGSHGRPRRRYKDNVTVDIREILSEDDWIKFSQ